MDLYRNTMSCGLGITWQASIDSGHIAEKELFSDINMMIDKYRLNCFKSCIECGLLGDI